MNKKFKKLLIILIILLILEILIIFLNEKLQYRTSSYINIKHKFYKITNEVKY
ncbi:hypothetical protein HAHI6034_11305 [Hathewaya histolytica]|uniref:Uncharacterized protein n=1 Tax=Hathewaya histolytica TaxID=1498 RepID=A0A4U9RMF4_HATHI|nr:Uncharacterised protein [Hathewaya histolytica]